MVEPDSTKEGQEVSEGMDVEVDGGDGVEVDKDGDGQDGIDGDDKINKDEDKGERI